MRCNAAAAAIALAISFTPIAGIADDDLAGRAYAIDGDTIVINSTHIRLWGIDAPERAQPYGPAATDKLRELMRDHTVTCTPHGHDHSYGRIVATCRTDAIDLNRAMVAAGLAWDDRSYSHGAYFELQLEARAAHRGLWADAEPEPPWHYRHSNHHER